MARAWQQVSKPIDRNADCLPWLPSGLPIVTPRSRRCPLMSSWESCRYLLKQRNAKNPTHRVPLFVLTRSRGSIAARLARLEEGDDLSVYISEPLDEDQVSGIIENA